MLIHEMEKYGKWMYEFDLGNGVKTPVYAESLKQVHNVRKSMIFSFLDSIDFNYQSNSLNFVQNNVPKAMSTHGNFLP